MLSKEELAQRYWLASMRERNRKRMQQQIKKLERQELDKPEYYLGILNEDDQYEVVKCKPLPEHWKLVPEVFGVIVAWYLLFWYLENAIGVFS